MLPLFRERRPSASSSKGRKVTRCLWLSGAHMDISIDTAPQLFVHHFIIHVQSHLLLPALCAGLSRSSWLLGWWFWRCSSRAHGVQVRPPGRGRPTLSGRVLALPAGPAATLCPPSHPLSLWLHTDVCLKHEVSLSKRPPLTRSLQEVSHTLLGTGDPAALASCRPLVESSLFYCDYSEYSDFSPHSFRTHSQVSLQTEKIKTENNIQPQTLPKHIVRRKNAELQRHETSTQRHVVAQWWRHQPSPNLCSRGRCFAFWLLGQF